MNEKEKSFSVAFSEKRDQNIIDYIQEWCKPQTVLYNMRYLSLTFAIVKLGYKLDKIF